MSGAIVKWYRVLRYQARMSGVHSPVLHASCCEALRAYLAAQQKEPEVRVVFVVPTIENPESECEQFDSWAETHGHHAVSFKSKAVR